MLFRAHFAARGESEQRRKIVIPDTAHGTNPATAAMVGYAAATRSLWARCSGRAEPGPGRITSH